MTEAGATDTAATEADASFDRPPDQYLVIEDSFVDIGPDGARAIPEVDVAAEAGDSVGDGGEARADLPLGTGGTFDGGEAGAGDGSGAGGVVASDGSAAAGGTGGTFDTGGAGGSDADDTDGMPGTDGAPATGGTDTGGTGGTGGTDSLPAGLVGWWKMDEAAGSSTAADASGNSNNATLAGLNIASAWTTGRTGGALKCDGSGGALVDDSVSLDGITTGVTISAWVNRLGATTGFTAVLSRETGTTTGQYYWLGLSGDRAEFYGSSGVLSTTMVPAGIWTHLAATHDGSTVRIYVNGSQVMTKSVNDVFRADTSKLAICGNQNDASGTMTERWNGLVDDLRLYNRPLTATEIATLAK